MANLKSDVNNGVKANIGRIHTDISNIESKISTFQSKVGSVLHL